MPESDENAVEFGRRLRETRKRRRLKQAALAEKAQVPTSSISHFEHGKHKPSYDSLVRLADILDVSIDYLVGRTGNQYAHADDEHGMPPMPMSTEQIKQMETFIDYLKMTGRYSEDSAPFVSDKQRE